MVADDPEEGVCHVCIGDPFLSAEAAACDIVLCFACAQNAPGKTIEAIGDLVHPVFQAWFHPVHEDRGDPASQLIAEMVGMDEEAGERIVEYLSAEHGYTAVRDGGDDPYDSLQCFAANGPERMLRRDGWQDFKTSLQRQARFFNRDIKAWLDDIFVDVAHHRTWKNEPLVREIVPGDKVGFFRARAAHDEREVREILQAPQSRLGPPPAGTARAGRMNAAGIAVFYSALDLDTCIAEIRPPVGAYVVHGRFDLLRPVRLLDLDVAERIVDDASYFDPDHDQKAARAATLRAIGHQIAWPVMPSDELLGYLPTQVIAEYLAQQLDPPLDGILYRSTQTDSSGRNVVLFNHASRVETFDPATHEIDVNSGWVSEDDFDDSITVHIKRKAVPKSRPTGNLSVMDTFDERWEDLRYEEVDPRTVTLELDLDSLGVKQVQATHFDLSPRYVSVSIQTEKPAPVASPHF